MNELVTGEAVPLELRLAKLASRAVALAVDVVALIVTWALLIALLVQIVPDLDEAATTAVFLSAFVAIFVGVPTIVETLTRGKSLGKLALGLRVVRDDGGPVRFRHALVRALAGVFADFIVTVGVGALVCSILNERGKRIGDVLAGTVVVRERIPSTTAPLPQIPPDLVHWATGLEMSRLPDGLALTARTFMGRAPKLAPAVRDDLAARLAADVAAVVSPLPPPGTPAWAYLTAVLAERHRRAMSHLAPTETTTSAGPVPPVAPTVAPPAPAGPANPPPSPGPGGFVPPA